MNRAHLSLACSLIALSVSCGKTGPSAPIEKRPVNEVWISADQDKQMPLGIVEAAYQPVGGLVRTVGRLAFDDRHVAHVFSPVSGRVSRLVADLGQRVQAGQVLALIDSPDMGGALSDYHKAEASLVAADKELARQKELYEGHAGALRDLEAAEANDKSATAERDRAKQRADLFHGAGSASVSQGFQLRSPIAGEVIARGANPGMELQGQYGGVGAPELYTVGDLRSLWLLADLPEADTFRVKVGCAVTFTVSGWDSPFKGRIDWVAGSLDPATRTVRVRCEVPNAERLLKPEMFAQVSIEVDKAKALAIPRSSIVRLGSLTYAFVDLGKGAQGQHRFERRPVTVREQEAGDLVPVVSGIQAGEKVVKDGAIQLAGVD